MGLEGWMRAKLYLEKGAVTKLGHPLWEHSVRVRRGSAMQSVCGSCLM